MCYGVLKNRLRLSAVSFLPFLAIPPTLDYFKRDYYVKSFAEENKQLAKNRAVVTSILDEKR